MTRTSWSLQFRPDSGSSQDLALAATESCVSDVRAWLLYNRLMTNDSKTEFLIVGSRQQLSKISINSIFVGDSTIQPLHSDRNLGFWFDSNMSMSMSIHVAKTCSNAFARWYKIRQIRNWFLNPESAKTIIHALVTSHVDHCNSLFFGIPKYQTDRIQKVLNAAARLIFGLPKFDHTLSALFTFAFSC